MIEKNRQSRLWFCSHCSFCPAEYLCDEGWTQYACPEEYIPPELGGLDILHPLRPDLSLRLADCGGLDLDVRAIPQDLPALPRYIPQVRPLQYIKMDYPAVGVPLSEVISRVRLSLDRGENLRQQLRLPEKTKLILIGFANDQLLENIWPYREDVVARIADLGFDLVTAFDYSVWYEDAKGRKDTRLEHRYNMKRSLLIFELLQKYSVSAVPHIFWFNQRDLDDWCQWLNGNPAINMISIDLQTVDQDAHWNIILRGVSYLRDRAPRDLTCLFSGVGRPERILQLLEVWPNAILSNQQPYFLAAFRREFVPVYRTYQEEPSYRPRREIFTRQVEFFVSLVNRAKGGRNGYHG